MTTIEAKEKVKKILAIVNDPASSAGEKENGLKLAKKIADKYGFSINKGSAQKEPAKYHEPVLKVIKVRGFNNVLVKTMFIAMGIKYTIGSEKEIYYRSDISESIMCNIYNVLHREFEITKKSWRDTSTSRADARWFCSNFCDDFIRGYNGTPYQNENPYISHGYDVGKGVRKYVDLGRSK